MVTVFSSIIAFLVTIPLFGLFLTYLILIKLTKNRRSSVHKALDYSTILFVLAVHFLILTIWEKSVLWLIVLFMIVLAMVFVFIHWKVKKEIVLKLIFKGVWRVNFLVFFIVYLMLTLYGLVQRVLEFV
ncbi:MAG TPA: DUF3397 domain-containing protein [Bacillales bacterium]|nr:DUF3397 domain-containing protein [Bacillales bacterium]